MTNLRIRLMQPGEVEAVAAALEQTGGQISARWREHELGFREVLLAEIDGLTVGTVSISERQSADAIDMHVSSFEVAPPWRGKGIGGALIDHVVEAARRREMQRIYLDVRIDNPARRLYHRHGFRRVGGAFLNTWWRFEADGGQLRVEELSYRMVKRLRFQGRLVSRSPVLAGSVAAS